MKRGLAILCLVAYAMSFTQAWAQSTPTQNPLKDDLEIHTPDSPTAKQHNHPVKRQSHLVDRPKRQLFVDLKVHELTEDTKELAEQLEILPMIEELYDRNSTKTIVQKSIVRDKVLETILESYFDAASVQAEADQEKSSLQALQELLIARRDRSVTINNATNFIASGTLNTIGSILGFSAKAPPFPGNLNQMLSGVVSTGMSTYSLKQASGGKTKGHGKPTVLAELFGRPIDVETTYPESVWRFFHGKAPGHPGMTRVQVLEQNWIANHHLEPIGSDRSTLKIDIVCGVLFDRKAVVTIDDLDDQICMIEDVSTTAEMMTNNLRDLMRLIDTDAIPSFNQSTN